MIGLVTDFDRYGPNDMMTLRFIRMTAFPIGVVPKFVLKRLDGQERPKQIRRFFPDFAVPNQGPCPLLGDIAQMASIQWGLPEQLSSGRYTIVARFCDTPWEKMPARVATPVFEVNDHPVWKQPIDSSQ